MVMFDLASLLTIFDFWSTFGENGPKYCWGRIGNFEVNAIQGKMHSIWEIQFINAGVDQASSVINMFATRYSPYTQ